MNKVMIQDIKRSIVPNSIIVFFNNGLYKEVPFDSNHDIYVLVMSAYIKHVLFGFFFHKVETRGFEKVALGIAESLKNSFGYPEEFLAQVDSCLTNFSLGKEEDNE